eukprot:symbB.v1.2.034874.t1/scaffold4340.1/size40954/5
MRQQAVPFCITLFEQVFYADQLEHRHREIQQRLMPFFQSLGSDHPVVMHNVIGTERCDSDSASLYNLEEIRVIQRYVLDILDARGAATQSCDAFPKTPGFCRRRF